MEYKVNKSFIDKTNGKGYSAGSTFESDDSERVAFLNEKGFIVDIAPEDLDYIELKKVAKDLGIDGYNKMKTEALIEAIEKVKADKDDGSTSTEN